MTYLVITVRFLGDRYHGRTENGRLPEWPPSPLRLYQALVAGAAGRWHDPSVRDCELRALEWFQNLGEPPYIIAPKFKHAVPLLKYVPENLADIDPEKRDAKFCRPTLFFGDPKLTYYWSIGPADEDHAAMIANCARHCHSLGWGIDMAVAHGAIANSEPDVASGETWLPMQNTVHGVPLRVPLPGDGPRGTLDQLLHRFAASLERIADDGRNPVAPLTAYRVVGYRRATDPPARPYAAFAFYRPDENKMRSFSGVRAIAVAGMVRCLAGKMARQTGYHVAGVEAEDWVNEYVMGHGDTDELRPRFSYLPLPTIRPQGVLGDIRRVIVAEEPGGAGGHAAWAARTLRGQVLVSEQQREEALLMALGRGDGVLGRYVATSHTWATVTPLVLPGSDDGKSSKADKLFAKVLRHAGYCTEALGDFELRNVCFWPGADLALRYQRPEYLKRQHWSVYHARIRWREAVSGPIALGAGRHCGLGVFASTQE